MHAALLCLLIISQPTEETDKMVFLGLGAETGVDAGVAKLLSEVAVTQMQQIYPNIISGSDMESMVSMEATKAQYGCDDAACLAEIGMALGARYLVSGGIGLIGSRYILTLKLIDSTTVNVINRVSTTSARNEDQLVEAVGPAVGELLKAWASKQSGQATAATAAPPATVTATADQGGGIGTLPIAGFAVAGVGIIGGVAFGMMARGKQEELDKINPPTAAQVESYESLRSQAKSRALLADISFGIAVAGATVGVLGLLLGGDDDSPASAQLTITPRSIALAGRF